jgi:VWFA-related protein
MAAALLAAQPALSSTQGLRTPSSRQQPSIRTTSEAVLVDFVVRDGRGRPVVDLRPEEIEVYEDGVLQQIQGFTPSRFAVSAVQPGAGTGDVAAMPAGGPVDQSEATTAAADLQFPSLVALVFDQLSISGRNLAGTASRQFVERFAGPESLVSVWVIDHGLHAVQEFTGDPKLLIHAVERATSLAEVPYQDLSREVMERMEHYMELRRRERGPLTDALGAMAPRMDTIEMKTAELVLNILRISETGQREQQGRASMLGLTRLFRALGGVSGRKSVVYFSEGIELPPAIEQYYDAAIHQANRHQVAVYAVDARGLQAERQLEEAARGQRLAAEMGRLQQTTFTAFFTLEDIKLVDTSREVIFKNPQGFLRALAEGTGGNLIANTNDLAGGLEKVAQDLLNHYELAYLPARMSYDGRFRRIEVRVLRPGVSVQARSGYFALPPDPGFEAMPWEYPLLQALVSSGPRRDLTLDIRLLQFQRQDNGFHCVLVAELPLGELDFQRIEDRFQTRLAVLALIRDSRGQVVEKYSQFYPVSAPSQNLEAVKASFAVFLKQLVLPAGEYTVEAIADGGNRGAGIVRQRFEVGRETGGIQSSSIVLLREARPHPEEDPDPDDPLNYMGLRLLPRAGKVPLASGQALPLYLVLYPEASRPEPPQLTFMVKQKGRTVQSLAVQLPAVDDQGRIPCVLSLPSDWFPRGTHTVVAEIRQGDLRFEEQLDFEVR